MLNIEGRDGGSSGEQNKPSRRAVLLGAVAGAAGILGLGALVQKAFMEKKVAENPHSQESSILEPEVFVDEHVYVPGDTIKTPIASIKIDGWKVLFEELGILGSTRDMYYNGTAYNFTIKCPLGHHHGFLGFTTATKSSISLGDTLETRRNPESSKTKGYYNELGVFGSTQYYFVHALPHLESKPMTLELVISDSDRPNFAESLSLSGKIREPKPSKIFRYSFSPTVYSYGPEDKNDEVRIVSERDVPSGLLRHVHNVHRIFSSYKRPALVYIIDEGTKQPEEAKPESNEFGQFWPRKDFVLLATDSFLRPDFSQQGEQIACHEIAHSIMQYAKFEGEEKKALAELTKSFEMIKERAGNQPKIYPAFSIFREATYKGASKSGIDSVAGHPWDNPGEFFASAITTFRYFGREFARRYSTLYAEDKVLVRNATLNVMEFLKAMNPSEGALRRLLPRINYIKGALG